MYIKTFVIVIIIAIVIGGCSENSTSPVNTTPPENLTVSPIDGQSRVRLDAAITFTFAKPVDRAVVQRNFHLVSQRAMADSLCPVDTTMRHGMMTFAMMDSMKMNHLIQQHATRGRLIWLNDTQCALRPDSLMTPRTLYMIHMGREMMQMMEQRMGSMGMMGGHGTGMMSNDMMFHFVTMDTTGGGHGHH